MMFFKKAGTSAMADCSKNYADPSVAAKQRQIADEQLRAMRDGNPPPHFAVVGRILSQLKQQTNQRSLSLLDAGCGSAYYYEIVHHFLPDWVRYFAADFNHGMLTMARQYYPGLPAARMDLRWLAIRDLSMDLVLSGAAIAHIKEWGTAVEELARVTRRWLLLHRTLVNKSEPTTVSVERHYDKDVYRLRVSEQELLNLMKKLGMTLVMKCDAGEGAFPSGQENNTYLFDRQQSSCQAVSR